LSSLLGSALVGGGKGDERFCNQITSANVRSDERITIPR